MAGVHHDSLIRRSGSWACILACWINAIASAQGPSFPQGGPQPGEYAPPNIGPAPGAPGNPGTYRPGVPENIGPAPTPGVSSMPAPAPRPGETLVVEVVFEGMKLIRGGQLAKLGTRAGEPYDPQIVEEDVKKLMKSRKFIDVAPKIQSVPQGVIVIFQVVERPIIQYIKMVGNQGVLTSTLIGKTDLKVGDGMDPYSIKEARTTSSRNVKHQEHGWDRARVSIIEGNKPGDKGAIFLIDEGRAQKVWWTKFVGNTIVTAARLRTQIEDQAADPLDFQRGREPQADRRRRTKTDRLLPRPRLLSSHGGPRVEFRRKAELADRSPLHSCEDRLTQIRNVSFIGNQQLGSAPLGKDLKLTAGEWFNQGAMNHDLNVVRDLYGGKGYVFADVQPDPRLLEGQAQMDLIYNIKEGSPYRVEDRSARIENIKGIARTPTAARSTIGFRCVPATFSTRANCVATSGGSRPASFSRPTRQRPPRSSSARWEATPTRRSPSGRRRAANDSARHPAHPIPRDQTTIAAKAPTGRAIKMCSFPSTSMGRCSPAPDRYVRCECRCPGMQRPMQHLRRCSQRRGCRPTFGSESPIKCARRRRKPANRRSFAAKARTPHTHRKTRTARTRQ